MIIKSLKRPNTRKMLLVVVTVLVVLILTFLILESTGVTHLITSPNNQTTEQKSEAEINSKYKKSLIENKSNDPSAQNNTYKEHTPGDINLTTQNEADGSVTIATQLKNYSDGTCNLTIKNGSDTYTKSAPILFQSSFSTCEGFYIPPNTITRGTWEITLSVSSKGKINTKTISAEVQ